VSKEAILVAHGSPAAPAPQEAAMMALAVRVSMWLPGWHVRGATLAQDGALEAAVSKMNTPLIYPFFMAEGWFTRINLPRRLNAAGAASLTQLAPFGTDPKLIDVIAKTIAKLDLSRGLLIAAHGSKVSQTSSNTTYDIVKALAGLGIGPIKAGFVEEAPFLVDVAREMPDAVCLPFFALRAGHVVQDIPEALSKASFSGTLLPPLGENISVAQLIASALERATAQP
jgi:sirohydrochlorin ferrochelatase